MALLVAAPLEGTRDKVAPTSPHSPAARWQVLQGPSGEASLPGVRSAPCMSALAAAPAKTEAVPAAAGGALPYAPEFMQTFWDLASVDGGKRRQAAQMLVDEFSEQAEPGASVEEVQDKQLTYTLRRLVRGLCSSRDGARHGFCLALTELLCTHDAVTPTRVLELMKAAMKTSSSMKGNEEREIFFGRVFGCMALIRSGRLTADEAEARKMVAELLAGAATAKSFLREICVELIGQLVTDTAWVVFETDILPLLLPIISEPMTAETVQLVCRLHRVYPGKLPSKGSGGSSLWNKKSLLHAQNLLLMVEPLKDSTQSHPRVHSAWRHLMAELQDASDPTAMCDQLSALWTTVVENGLLPSTHERRYLAFELVGLVGNLIEETKAYETDCAADLVGSVLSPQFVKCLASNIANQNGLLNSSARSCLAAISKLAGRGEGDRLRMRVIKSVIDVERHFDQITRTKFVANELGKLGAQAIAQYTDYLGGIFAEHAAMAGAAGEGEEGAERLEVAGKGQIWAMEQLYALAKMKTVEETRQKSILCLFLTHGFCTISSWKGKKSDALKLVLKHCSCAGFCASPTDAVRDRCRQRAFSLLQELSSAKPIGDVKNGEKDAASFDEPLSVTAIEYVSALLQCDGVELDSSLSPSALEALEVVEETMLAIGNRVTKICKSKASRSGSAQELRRLRAFQYLLSNLRLQHLQDQDEMTEVLNDVCECFSKIVGKGGQGDDDDDEEEENPVTVLVDCMLSLLTKPSALIRDVVRVFFTTFAADINESSFGLLLNALGPEAGMDEKEGDDADEDEDLFSDSDDGDDDDDNDASSQQSAGAASTQQKNGKASSSMAVDDDAGESDSDLDDENEPDYDDDAMFKMGVNEKLVELLRLTQEGKKRSLQEKRRVMGHWKLRVLDLIEIMVKRDPASNHELPWLVGLPIALLRCMVKSSQHVEGRPVFERCSGVLMKLAGAGRAKKGQPGSTTVHSASLGPDHHEKIQEGLHELLQYLMRTPVRAKLAIASVTYLLRASRSGEAKAASEEAVAKELGETYQQCITRRTCKLQIKFFTELMPRQPWLGGVLLPHLTGLTETTPIASAYLRTEALQMLSKLFSQKHDGQQVAKAVSSSTLTAGATIVIQSIEILESPAATSGAEDTGGKGKGSAQRLKQVLLFALAGASYSQRVCGCGVLENTSADEFKLWKQIQSSVASMTGTAGLGPVVRQLLETMEPKGKRGSAKSEQKGAQKGKRAAVAAAVAAAAVDSSDAEAPAKQTEGKAKKRRMTSPASPNGSPAADPVVVRTPGSKKKRKRKAAIVSE